jgi:hypothetical protein
MAFCMLHLVAIRRALLFVLLALLLWAVYKFIGVSIRWCSL